MRASHLLLPGCAALLLSAVTAGAQEVRVPGAAVLGPRAFEPAQVTSPAISLSEAVRLTVLHSPRLVSGAQGVEVAAGQFREQRGAFDGYLVVSPTIEYALEPLVPTSEDVSMRASGASDRATSALLPLAVRIRALARDLRPHEPACPRVYENLQTAAGGFRMNVSGLCAIVPETRESDMVAARPGTPGPSAMPNAVRDRGFASAASAPDLVRAQPATESQPSALADLRGWLAASSQAGIADTLRRGIVGLDVGYTKPFRSGVQLDASLQFQASEDIYEDVPRDPALGGSTTPNRFWTTLPVSLTLPLAKGRGAVAVAAAERAARIGVEAQREDLRHAITEEVYRTVLAYATLAVAQEEVALLDESAARQAAIVDMTRQRAEAGEVPQMDLNWAEARAAAVQAALLGARSRLVTSRVGLVQNIGASVGSVGAMPRAAETLDAAPVPTAGVPELVQLAEARRHDTKALKQFLLASSAIDDGARSDLKRRVDLAISGGVRNTYEVPPYPPPLGIFDPRGFWRSLTGRVDPFVTASLTVELPFGNNVARGRAAQTLADVRSREIDIEDLTRSIRENIIGTTGALALTAAALERVQAAVRADEETLAGTLSLYRAGEVTLLDMLITEEQMTSDKLAAARLRQSYVSLLARLRFEAGDIVRFDPDETGGESVVFDPAGLVGK